MELRSPKGQDGNVLPYDGLMLRWEAADGKRLLSEYCPQPYSAYLEREPVTDRLVFFPAKRILNSAFEQSRDRLIHRLEREAGKMPPLLPYRLRETSGLLIETDTAGYCSLRSFVRANRPSELTREYLRDCLRLIRGLVEGLQGCGDECSFPGFTPDTVFLSELNRQPALRLADPTLITPRLLQPEATEGLSASLELFQNEFMRPEALRFLVLGGEPPQAEAWLYSASQLLCYMLFSRSWRQDAEMLSVHFPTVGALEEEAVRRTLEDAVFFGLGMAGEAEVGEWILLLESAAAYCADSVFRSDFRH